MEFKYLEHAVSQLGLAHAQTNISDSIIICKSLNIPPGPSGPVFGSLALSVAVPIDSGFVTLIFAHCKYYSPQVLDPDSAPTFFIPWRRPYRRRPIDRQFVRPDILHLNLSLMRPGFGVPSADASVH